MGARGPLPAPRGLKIVGAAEVEDARTLADELKPGAPDKPADLVDEAATALWDILVPQLDELGLVSVADGPTIGLAIRHYLAAVKASDELAAATSAVVWDEKNGRQQKHPADAVFRLHSEMFLKYAERMGMTFVSRARLTARGDAAGDDSNPFTPAANG